MIRRKINKALWLFVHKVPWKPILIWGPTALLILIPSFYAFENWRGARAWKQAQENAKAAGVSLDYRDYFPEVPENGFELSTLPGFDGNNFESFKHRMKRGDVGLNTTKGAYSSNERWKAQAPDITLWLDPTDAPKTQSEAAARLEKIAEADFKRLASLCAATDGKLLYEETNQSGSLDLMSPTLKIGALSIAEFINDSVSVSLAREDSAGVVRDIRLLRKLCEIKSSHNLVSHLVSIAIVLTTEKIIWQAVLSQKLNVDQLKEIRGELELITPLKNLPLALKGEFALSLAFWEDAKSDSETRGILLALAGIEFTSVSPSGLWIFDDFLEQVDELIVRGMPKGWFALEQANLASQMPILDFQSRIPSWIELHKTFVRLENNEDPFPLKLFKNPTENFFSRCSLRTYQAEARLRLARIGLSLEIFKLENGNYPQSLSQLPSQAPLDPWSGEPFRYRLKKDGTPLLWSPGKNQVDEDGLPNFGKSEMGDMVWQITPIPGLTQADLRKKLEKHAVK